MWCLSGAPHFHLFGGFPDGRTIFGRQGSGRGAPGRGTSQHSHSVEVRTRAERLFFSSLGGFQPPRGLSSYLWSTLEPLAPRSVAAALERPEPDPEVGREWTDIHEKLRLPWNSVKRCRLPLGTGPRLHFHLPMIRDTVVCKRGIPTFVTLVGPEVCNGKKLRTTVCAACATCLSPSAHITTRFD